MRVIFAGTPEFAKVALERLLAAGFDIPLVLTQPDRPGGRGMKLQASAVKQCAQTHKLQVIQPHGLRLDGKFATEASAAQQAIAQADADVMVVAAYGLILPPWALAAPRLGCINIHASLLPRWRGAAPIHRAIQAGDTETGVTLMQMDAGLDTGAMLMMRKLSIAPTDTTATLHDKLADLGGAMVVAALPQLGTRSLKPEPQPPQGVSYAHKIEKQEAAVDWSIPAGQIERNIRAFNPFPVVSTKANIEQVKLWCSEIESENFMSGKGNGEILSVDDSGVLVQCGVGTLRLTELQRAGGKRLASRDFVRGFALPVGTVLQ